VATLVLVAAAAATFEAGSVALAVATVAASVAGSYIDSKIFGASGASTAPTEGGPKLDDVRVTSASEGRPVSRVYGTARVGCEIIWATDFIETAHSQDRGGKGGMGGGGGGGTQEPTYTYACSFAAAVCAGEIDGVGRIWFDGKEVSASSSSIRQIVTTKTITTIYADDTTTSTTTTDTSYLPTGLALNQVASTLGTITNTTLTDNGDGTKTETVTTITTSDTAPLYSFRTYLGTETQLPDSYISLKDGSDYACAYRGVAYLFFENMQLEKVGNRIPQITIEVFRRPKSIWGDDSIGGVSSIKHIMQNVCEDYDVPYVGTDALYNLSLASGKLFGYTIDNLSSFRAAIEPLETVSLANSVESGGSIKVVPRGLPPVAIIDSEYFIDSVITDSGGRTSDVPSADTKEGHYKLVRDQEFDIPSKHILNYLNYGNSYLKGSVTDQRSNSRNNRTATTSLPTTMDSVSAKYLCGVLLREPWAAREKMSLMLPPSYDYLEPGDTIRLNLLTDGTQIVQHDMKISTIVDGAARKLECVSTNALIYNASASPPATVTVVPVAPTARVFGESEIIFADLPMLSDSHNEFGAYIYAHQQQPMPSTIVAYKSRTLDNYGYQNSIYGAAIYGKCDSNVSRRDHSRMDYVSSLDVTLHARSSGYPQLYSVTQGVLLSGANLCAVRGAITKKWEVFQYRDAELLGSGKYRLTNMLRGRRGSDPMDFVSGDEFVFLGSNITNLNFNAANLFIPYNWRYGPGSESIESSVYKNEVYMYSGEGSKCYSPTNVRARMNSIGDIVLDD
jgi:Putative phage tail protein